jgi:hypothetical protein
LFVTQPHKVLPFVTGLHSNLAYDIMETILTEHYEKNHLFAGT